MHTVSPACRLCTNIHHYAPSRIVQQQPAGRDGRSVGNMSMNVYAKFHCAALRFLTVRTRTTRVAFLDRPSGSKQLRKVLSTRKAPACLPCTCINIHHYSSLIGSTVQRAAGSGVSDRAATSLAAADRCEVSEGSLSSFTSITWNELW